MDILHLVDRLEELFNDSRSVPFTHSVMVDEERILDIIDQMRVSIPEEIKIWSGDSWLFQHQAVPNYRLLGVRIDTDMSTTSARPEFDSQKRADKNRARRLIPLSATYEAAISALDTPPAPIALDPSTFTSRTDQLKRALRSLRRRVGIPGRPRTPMTAARSDARPPRPSEPAEGQ